MTNVVVRADIDEALAKFTRLKDKDVPYATEQALNATARWTRTQLVEKMGEVFDRPTPWTLNAIYLEAARKQRLVATLKLKDSQVRYLLTEMEGGGRNIKAVEKLMQDRGVMPRGWYAVPGEGAPINAYGNVGRGEFTRILSQIQSSGDPLSNEPLAKRIKRDREKMAQRYFAVGRPNSAANKLKPGIYERLGGTANSRVRPVFIFTPKRPQYRKRFPFYEWGTAVAKSRFPLEFKAVTYRILLTGK